MAHSLSMKTIEQLRKSVAWTQENLAAELGVSQPTIARWESGGARQRDVLAVTQLVDNEKKSRARSKANAA